ncbi:hypothetical protein DPMN_007865, partial [Dreissena polymorpha]
MYKCSRKRKQEDANDEAVRIPKTRKIARIETFDFQASIKALCKKRNDDWATDILGRIEVVNDLPASEAQHFRTFLKNTDIIVESIRRHKW